MSVSSASELLARYTAGERDFTAAVLNGADLARANLAGADFCGANLARADFTGADCPGADFTDAVLNDADFSGADLAGADFCGARLTGAVLQDGDLLLGKDARGYTLVVRQVGDAWHVLCGCRHFRSIGEARGHWGSPKYRDPIRGAWFVSRLSTVGQPSPRR